MSANANNHDLPTRKTTYGLSGAKAVRSKLIYKAQRVLVTVKLSGSRLDLMSANANNHDLPTHKTTYGLSGARSKSARS